MNTEELDELAKKRVVYSIPGMERISVEKNIIYKIVGDTTLSLNVYYPLSMIKGMIRPAVLFVHGGGPPERVGQGKDMESFVSWSQLVAASGLVAVTFSHRQLWTLTKLEDARSDINDCIAYILEHGISLGIDTNALCIWSCSSGSLHSLRKMLRDSPTYIRCSVVYYGLLSLLNKKYYTYTSDEEEEIKEFSALHHLRETDKTIAPIFIARAGLDNDYLNDGLDTFVKEAIEKNIPLTFMNHPTGLHGFDILNDDEQSRRIIKATLEFMKAHLT